MWKTYFHSDRKPSFSAQVFVFFLYPTIFIRSFCCCVSFCLFFTTRAFWFRSRRQTSQPESTGTVEDQNWVGGGHHSCEVQQHHPDLGWGAAGGETAYHVLQWQDRKVTELGYNLMASLWSAGSCCCFRLITINGVVWDGGGVFFCHFLSLYLYNSILSLASRTETGANQASQSVSLNFVSNAES